MTDRPPRAVSPGKPSRIDTGTAHSARIYNYWLGGKDNFPADREAAEAAIAANPGIVGDVQANRAFLARVVSYLVADAGIRQFLDIGTGLPTADNTHEVAQRLAPGSRVVYVDNDPIVLAHARALLTSSPQGMTAYLEADLADPDTILKSAARTLDFSQPVALMLLGIMGQVPDSDDPRAIIRRLMNPMPSGSYLALSDGVNTSETFTEAVRHYNESSANTYHPRSPEQLTGYFDGLEVVEPGVVPLTSWRPEANPFPEAGDVPGMCGVGRKP